ncbi:HTH-type transcriptional repressor CzrA [uncultured Clostridium sp.]|uniref:ArsR/SmtB family transcription factor n=1 Tax=uncultured Clostridium sp. TaxID=59620 RepID=UPI000822770F|nr:metalloregulator ArsR/SmtB family transcription factor [uncultured Clostridium sp.]SCJ97675.1 HTH-type transcriptional repressor CzrA [uncultured Clostridium sp.]
MEEKIKIFKAIADETRLKILILVSHKNICAKGIAKHLNISEAAVSQHIKILKESSLIIGYKRGYHLMYELNRESLEESISFINEIINDDFKLISDGLSDKERSFDISVCKHSCKSMKNCCKNILKEE